MKRFFLIATVVFCIPLIATAATTPVPAVAPPVAQTQEPAPAAAVAATSATAAPATTAPATATPAVPKKIPQRKFHPIVEFFFPSLRTPPPDPMDTLQAPFALDPNAVPPSQKPDPNAAKLPENSAPLDLPHRDNTEISEWLTVTLSEALTFDKPDYQAVLNNNYRHFSQAGRAEYDAFLLKGNVIKVLESKKFYIRSFVEDVPLLLNQGAVNGSYRWLYEVPVMVSYMQAGVTDYKKLEPINQKVMITVQVGRVPSKTGDGIAIERWDVKAQRLDKK